MAEKTLVEVWIVLDSDGDYATGVNRDEAIERYEEAYGGAAGCRIGCVHLRMSPPTVAEIEAEMDDDAGEILEAAE